MMEPMNLKTLIKRLSDLPEQLGDRPVIVEACCHRSEFEDEGGEWIRLCVPPRGITLTFSDSYVWVEAYTDQVDEGYAEPQ